ncbi:MAG: formyltransferase family protein [Caldilineaceae bacterium]
MRIAIVTQEEPFYLPPALDALCRARRQDIVGMIILPAFNESLQDTAKRLYEFYGAFDFARLVGRYGRAKVADRINQLQPLTRPYSAKDVAKRHNIPVYEPANINAGEFIKVVRQEIRPDLMISLAASQILKKTILGVPPLGCINLHSAPLPRYQGMMPNFWTMVHGEPEATVTVHYMVEKLDAGDIILQRPVPIKPQDSLHDLMVRSKEIGAQALLDAVELIEKQQVQRKPLDQSRATYFSFPKRADAMRLRQMGRSLL